MEVSLYIALRTTGKPDPDKDPCSWSTDNIAVLNINATPELANQLLTLLKGVDGIILS